jgi:hypothetical protein
MGGFASSFEDEINDYASLRPKNVAGFPSRTNDLDKNPQSAGDRLDLL